MQARFKSVAFLLSALLVLSVPLTGAAALNFFDLLNLSESSESYYTVKDRRDRSVILRTARILHLGDTYIDEGNRHFRVVELEGQTAWAERIDSESSRLESSEIFAAAAADGAKERPRVGVYHTHGAESYVPSDGTDTIAEGGGILRVGDSFAHALEEKGFPVNHIREAHTPHDAGAYQRSRRTAEELLTEGDQLIFDVHRDAVPPEEYEGTVEGEEVTKILLVVGQQNQNADNNRDFALSLKQIADERQPGLIKGILGAQGNYNQDLTPQAILLEVGAHRNDREDAERAVTLFADVVDRYAAGSEAAVPPAQSAQANRFSLGSVLKAVLALAAVLFLYLLVSTGSWEELKSKVTSFFEREFADVLALRRRGRGEEEGD